MRTIHPCRLLCTLTPLCLLLSLTGCDTTRPAAARPAIEPAFASADDGRQSLRVLSLNLRRPFFLDGPNHWNFRRGEMIRLLAAQGADLIGTQECVSAQAKDLLTALPAYAMIGAGRSDGEGRGEMCAVFYRRDRFDVVEQGHFWLSDTPARPGSKAWGALWTRMVTWARLHDHATGRDLHLFNTHFSVASGNARDESATLLRQRIAAIAPDGPVLVTGDFNEDADGPAYRRLTRDHPTAPRLHDTYRAIHRTATDEPGTRHRFRGGTGGPRIDWVLTSDHLTTLDARVLTGRVDGRMVSDHHPVHAELRYRDQAPIVRAPEPHESTAAADGRLGADDPSRSGG